MRVKRVIQPSFMYPYVDKQVFNLTYLKRNPIFMVPYRELVKRHPLYEFLIKINKNGYNTEKCIKENISKNLRRKMNKEERFSYIFHSSTVILQIFE